MKLVVIDTNVLVSAVLSPDGNPALILNMISHSKLHLFYSEKIIDEYRRVLTYERLNISSETQGKAIEGIKNIGTLIKPPFSTVPLPDETDRIFYDTAIFAGAVLVTRNIKHFPDEQFIMTPAEILRKIEIVI